MHTRNYNKIAREAHNKILLQLRGWDYGKDMTSIEWDRDCPFLFHFFPFFYRKGVAIYRAYVTTEGEFLLVEPLFILYFGLHVERTKMNSVKRLNLFFFFFFGKVMKKNIGNLFGVIVYVLHGFCISTSA